MGENAGHGRVESEIEVLLFFLNRGARRGGPGIRWADRPAAARPRGAVRDQPARPDQASDGVEEHWFQLVFLGQDHSTDMSMQMPAGPAREQIVAAYRQTCARSDEIARACPELSVLAKAG